MEDDSDIRDAVCELLREEGYHVDAAANGREAVDFLRRAERDPCIVLLDLMMPDMNGWQVLEILRREDRLMTLPVTVMSAASAEASMPAGVGYLKKPVALDTLLDAVRAFCG